MTPCYQRGYLCALSQHDATPRRCRCRVVMPLYGGAPLTRLVTCYVCWIHFRCSRTTRTGLLLEGSCGFRDTDALGDRLDSAHPLHGEPESGGPATAAAGDGVESAPGNTAPASKVGAHVQSIRQRQQESTAQRQSKHSAALAREGIALGGIASALAGGDNPAKRRPVRLGSLSRKSR